MTISHSQFYTSKQIALLLIKCIELDRVNVILDLGAGNGSLTCAACNSWPNAKIVTADIDADNCNTLSDKGFYVKHVDCLLPNLNKKLNVCYESVDVCVCNPPYSMVEYTQFFESLLNRANLRINRRGKNISTDLVFLAYNLLFLRPHGVLAIIVPYSIIVGKNFSKLRECLMHNYYLERVVELPERCFSYTEAKTGILIIRKESPMDRKTQINTVEKDFNILDSLTPTRKQLMNRMDYSYYNWKRTHITSDNAVKSEIKIVRGKYTHEELKRKSHPFFHTTYFDRDDIDWNYKYNSSEKSVIGEGAFLMARVGKRCVGKVKFIESGHIQISDCIYAIHIPNKYVDDFKSLFKSNEYHDFIRNNIRGVCSLYLCKCDLESFLSKKMDEFIKNEH